MSIVVGYLMNTYVYYYECSHIGKQNCIMESTTIWQFSKPDVYETIGKRDIIKVCPLVP